MTGATIGRRNKPHHNFFSLPLLLLLWCCSSSSAVNVGDRRRPGYASSYDAVRETVESLVRQWAPMVWLAPGEQFLPGNVNDFLRHVHAEKSTAAAASVLHQTADILDVSDDVLLYELDREIDHSEQQQQQQQHQQQQKSPPAATKATKKMQTERVIDLPIGKRSFDWFLTTNEDVDAQLEDSASFLYGQDPNRGQVPIYAVVNMCEQGVQDAFAENDIDFYDRTDRATYIPIKYNGPPSMPAFTHRFQAPAKNYSSLLRRSKRGSQQHSDGEPLKLGSSFAINSTSPSPSPLPTVAPERPNTTVRTVPEWIPQFHVTYWMFYPYNQGKTICTLNLGPLGRLPIPQLFGKCLGTRRDFGSHVGDWEHMTLHFRAGRRHEPTEMYVSAHDAGAYYTYERLSGSFDFRRQETRQHHLLQQPVFPKTVRTLADSHPVLFSARGSHGLWTAPGRHRFVRVPRLVDVNGFGRPWYTWKNMEFSWDERNNPQKMPPSQRRRDGRRVGKQTLGGSKGGGGGMAGPEWLQYMGRWGNAKSKCHPLKRLGLNFCEYNDGPTGIPLKEAHFVCKR